MCSGSVRSVIDWLSSSIMRLAGSTHQLFSANRLSASGGAFGVRVRAPDVEINILGRRGVRHTSAHFYLCGDFHGCGP